MGEIPRFLQENLHELFWGVFCVFLGWFLEWSRQKVLLLRRRKKRQKKREQLTSTGILSLDHGDPFYGADEDGNQTGGAISCLVTDHSPFFIPLPESLIDYVSQLKHPVDFVSRPATWFGEELSSFAELQEKIRSFGLELENQQPNLDLLLETARDKVAHSIICRIKSGAVVFNGLKFGIRKINVNRTADEHENSVLTLELYETDYFTYLVMGQLCKDLTELKRGLPRTNSIPTLNSYYPFLTSLGVNALVVSLQGNDKGKVALCLRSGSIDNMNGKALWHVSMNEGMSITDKSGARVYLDKCVERGLAEELNIKLTNSATNPDKVKGDIFYGDLFQVTNTYEVGITAICRVNMSCIDIAEAHNKAKDSALETDSPVKFIDLTPASVKQFLKNHHSTDILRYALTMATLVNGQFYGITK